LGVGEFNRWFEQYDDLTAWRALDDFEWHESRLNDLRDRVGRDITALTVAVWVLGSTQMAAVIAWWWLYGN